MKEKITGKYPRLNDPKVMTGAALLIALAVVVDFYRLVLSNIMEVSFGFVPLAVGGMMYGPIIGGIIGGIADIIQYVARPTGPFFPGFTFNAILAGYIYGKFFYKKEITIKRVILCVLLEGVLITLILTPLWLNMLYGAKIFALPRVIKFVAFFPVKVAILYMMGQFLKKYKLIKD